MASSDTIQAVLRDLAANWPRVFAADFAELVVREFRARSDDDWRAVARCLLLDHDRPPVLSTLRSLFNRRPASPPPPTTKSAGGMRQSVAKCPECGSIGWFVEIYTHLHLDHDWGVNKLSAWTESTIGREEAPNSEESERAEQFRAEFRKRDPQGSILQGLVKPFVKPVPESVKQGDSADDVPF